MKRTKCDYTWEISDGKLKIIDLNLGNKSVTNDIENVLLEIRDIIGNKIEDLDIIYRDSEGVWDAVEAEWNPGDNVRILFKPYKK